MEAGTVTPDLDAIIAGLRALDERRRYFKIDYFEPYPKQQDFFLAGNTVRERLLMAGNQLGKTYAGAAEVAYHLTGDYSWWWTGRRFTHAVSAWAAGETSILVRDGPQKLLCGQPGVEEAFGTGLIPKAKFVDRPSLARGVTDAYDTIQVRHATGGISTLTFKSYEQGRPKFQSATLDFIWLDEEPDIGIYSECLARITATSGFLFMTFTPLKGMSDVVSRFLHEPSEDRAVVNMVIEDAKHIPASERAKIIAGYPEHEREARARGVPMLGSGRIFKIAEETIREPILDLVPSIWVKGWGIDFGIAHNFAAVLCAWDRDNDVIHVLHAFRMKDGDAMKHAVQIKHIGVNIPVFWPQDGHQRDKGSGFILSKQYKDQGLNMFSHHATWIDGSNHLEPGIAEMENRLATGRLKVAQHLSEWFEEYRLYHRVDGQVVKERDDLLAATRYAIMMKRFWLAIALGSDLRKRRLQAVAKDVDIDPWNP